jgi:hypothetical protein
LILILRLFASLEDIFHLFKRGSTKANAAFNHFHVYLIIKIWGDGGPKIAETGRKRDKSAFINIKVHG